LAAAGQKIDRRLIHLPEPIKTTGQYEIEVRLHREVVSKIKVEVAGEAVAAT
jgi:large subunit ribosomal protein L9